MKKFLFGLVSVFLCRIVFAPGDLKVTGDVSAMHDVGGPPVVFSFISQGVSVLGGTS